MMKEKGFQSAEVTHEITRSCRADPSWSTLDFNMSEGPKVKIRNVDFTGNTGISPTARSRAQMKENKEHWFLSFITGRGTYQETSSRRTPSA